MKYLEELSCGECFKLENNYWLLTYDFKKDGKRLCYDLSSGLSRWLDGNTIVNINPIYYLDNDNNIIPIKKYSK